MLKRLRWMVVGALLAGALYVWLSGRLRTGTPERLASDAGRATRDLGERMRAAWHEGRDEMSRREDELRRDLLR